MNLITVYIGVVVIIVELAIRLTRWRLSRRYIGGRWCNIYTGRDESWYWCIGWRYCRCRFFSRSWGKSRGLRAWVWGCDRAIPNELRRL
jgi:hypothetical protein